MDQDETLHRGIGLGPGHIPLDGDPAPLQQGVHPPIFSPCLLWPNGWMDQDASGTEVGLRPGDSVTWGPSSPPNRGTAAPPLFGPYIVPNG